MSVPASTSLPSNCSGAIYCRVPTMAPSAVSGSLAAGVEDADVRMIQAGDGPCFPLESFAQFGTICKLRRQNLDGDDAVQPRVAGAVHLTHPARANAGEDFVGP